MGGMPADMVLKEDLTADIEAGSRDVYAWTVGKGKKGKEE